MVSCPRCGTPIQPTWDWCLGCGFDPEGLKPAGWQPGAPASPFAAPVTRAPPAYGAAPEHDLGRTLRLVAIAVVAVIVVSVGVGLVFSARSGDGTDADGTNAGDAAVPTSEAPWTTYTTPDGAATIDFPGTPQPQPAGQTIAGIADQHSVAYVQGAFSYLFAYFDLEPDRSIDDPAVLLNGSVDGLATTTKLTDVSRSTSTFAGLPSVEFHGTAKLGTPTEVRGIAVLNGHRIYLIAAFSEPGAPVAWLRFVSSWHLL